MISVRGGLLMTAQEKFEQLTVENKEIIIRQIETLIKNQSESRSSSDSQE